ncbi:MULTISPECIES: TRAP transporter substrate-binding protein [Kordiimonas]|jgi:TRAP-type mannitol/chloroaromatic compound transport system substrate-binding protein|uniref:TRAP transporter substrate-binding protein n=1 Tax=Kordiimonas TaxID=288021 RepID=UPI00257FCA13|nr:TRAP transporter substrate-binding protein [Kordiimonas sp. UBA4487]
MRAHIIAALATCSLLSGCGTEEAKDQSPVQAPEKIEWRMTSTYPSTLIQLGTMGKRLEREVNAISGGNITLKFYEPGVIAPPFETFDAISYGAIEAGWSTPGYWAGKDSALQLFSAVPFGPSAPEYLAWIDYGGGRELFEEVYHKHNIHSILCGMTPPEASGWFKKEIKSIDDFKGLKIRFFGLGAKVMEEIGASPQLIAGGEIYQALELGTIDATEYAMPAVDYRMGFYQVAKHYYFPGWHQQSTFFELMINLDGWNSLSDLQKTHIEATCSSNIRYGISEGEALQADAMAALEAAGVQIHTWSPEILAELEAAWNKVAARMASDDPEFARVWESLQAFRKKYKAWSDRGYLKE